MSDPAGLIAAVVAAAAGAAGGAVVRALTLPGAAAAFCVGVMVFGLGGAGHAVALVSFFVSSSLLSAAGLRIRRRRGSPVSAAPARDAWQVAANGLIPALIALASALTNPGGTPSSREWLLLSAAALASMNADTWATEIGGLARARPRMMGSWKPVAAGESGGVTLLGVAAGLAGSLFVALMVAAWWPVGGAGLIWRPDLGEVFAVTWAGFLAMLADSILGAGVQARFRCRVCGSTTEERSHCSVAAERVSGWGPMDNNAVNLTASALGVAFAWILLRWFGGGL
ncbi:MAG: DUF92 domain-containing protein [Armatimonadetes bacterium]|nr:DUF92 domain-containing protein [Armatimonadota bacterium]